MDINQIKLDNKFKLVEASAGTGKRFTLAHIVLRNVLEKKVFSERWIGNKTFSKGERDNIEMKMCFGNKKEPDFFFENQKFDKLSFRLYGPLIKALKK